MSSYRLVYGVFYCDAEIPYQLRDNTMVQMLGKVFLKVTTAQV